MDHGLRAPPQYSASLFGVGEDRCFGRPIDRRPHGAVGPRRDAGVSRGEASATGARARGFWNFGECRCLGQSHFCKWLCIRRSYTSIEVCMEGVRWDTPPTTGPWPAPALEVAALGRGRPAVSSLGIRDPVAMPTRPQSHSRFATYGGGTLCELLFARLSETREEFCGRRERITTKWIRFATRGHWGQLQRYRFLNFYGRAMRLSDEHLLGEVLRWCSDTWWKDYRDRHEQLEARQTDDQRTSATPSRRNRTSRPCSRRTRSNPRGSI